MTERRAKRAVVFDLDGTLVDSLPLVLAAIAHAIEPFGGRPTMDIFAHLGGPPERFLATLVNDVKHVPVALTRMETYHRDNAHLIQPYDGARRVLEELHDAGVAVALWTGRDRGTTEPLLRTHDLARFFATAVCGDDLATHKPDSEGLREILRRLAVAPEDTLFVGDADVDVLGGVGANVDTLLIRHARDIPPAIAAQAWQSVPTPADAYKIVRRWMACIPETETPSAG